MTKSKKKELNKTKILLKHIIEAIKKFKGENITSLDFEKIDNPICKYFVICSGTSNTHVNAIEIGIKKIISKELSEKPWSTEGSNNAEWILMDYSDIIIHIFQKRIRDYYDLESFWGDAKFINYEIN